MGDRGWLTKTSRYILEDKWISMRADVCETAEGVVVDPYYVMESSDWVHIAAFDKDNRRPAATANTVLWRRIFSTEVPPGAIGKKRAADRSRQSVNCWRKPAVLQREMTTKAGGLCKFRPARQSRTFFPCASMPGR